jgi:hypothetical protein
MAAMTGRYSYDNPDNMSRRARVEQERELEDRLEALRTRLLDVPEYRDLVLEMVTLKNTPLECGCHCTGGCGNLWNPCDRACSTHMCL